MTSELVPWRGHNVPVIRPAEEISRYSLTDYFNWVLQAQGSNLQTVTGVTYTQGKRAAEPIANNFAGFVEGLFYRDGPVAAVEWKRVEVFSQAAMLFQKREDGQFNKLYDDASLDLLRTPWLGGSTASLMARALLFADLGGNAYIIRVDDELVVLRPDWVEIILEARMLGSAQVGWRKVGYAYHEGGLGNGETAYLTVDEVAHFAPDPDPLASYRGMSWLTPIVREVMADKQAQDHKLNFFENAASPNLAVSLPKELTADQFKAFVDLMDSKHSGVQNAGKTLYTGGGADVTVIGANMQQMDFAAVQGKGETRIANAGRVPAVVVGFSEGMQGSSLNAGNYQASKRSFADTTCQYLWAAWCPALSVLFPAPNDGDRLWYNQRGIPYLNEDAKDVAEIQQMQAAVLSSLITSGFVPDTAKDALTSDDMSKLKHSGLTSVQLLPPGSRDTNGDGHADQNDASVAADGAAEDDYQSALEAARAEWLADDSISRARYNIRNPAGSVGGGRFRKISAVIIHALEGWMNGEGDDDPLEPFEAPQLREAAKQLGLVKDRERVSKPELKKRLLAKATADVHEQKHGGKPAPKAEPDAPKAAPKPKAAAKVAKAAPKAKPDADEPPRMAGALTNDSDRDLAQRVLSGRYAEGARTMNAKPLTASQKGKHLRQAAQTLRVVADDQVRTNPSASTYAEKKERNARADKLDAIADVVSPRRGSSPAATKVKAARAPKAKAPKESPEAVVAKLDAATTREEAREILAGKTLAELRLISPTSAGVAKTRPDLVEAIVGLHVGSRLSFQSIFDEARIRDGRGGAPKPKAKAPKESVLGGPMDDVEADLHARTTPQLRKIATAANIPLPPDAKTKPAIIAAMLKQADQDFQFRDKTTAGGHALHRPGEGSRGGLRAAIADVDSTPTGPGDVAGMAAKLRGGTFTEGEALRLINSDAGLGSAKLRKLADELGIDMPASMRSKGSMQLHIAHQLSIRKASTAPHPEGRGPEGLSTDLAVRDVQVENRIRAAYLDAVAAGAPGYNGTPVRGYARNPLNESKTPGIRLSALRERIGGDIPRAELDAALLRLRLQDDVYMDHDSNQKTLTQTDWDAAVITPSGHPNTMITLMGGSSSPRPIPAQTGDSKPGSPDYGRLVDEADAEVKRLEGEPRRRQLAGDPMTPEQVGENVMLTNRARAKATSLRSHHLAAQPRSSDRDTSSEQQQALLNIRREMAETLIELDDMRENGASQRAIEHRLRARAGRTGLPAPLIDEMLQASTSGDQSRVQALIDRLARENNLTRVSGPAGSVEPFDRRRHDPVGGPIRDGAMVHIMRPGYSADDVSSPQGPVLLEKAKVQDRGDTHDLSSLNGLSTAEKRAKMRRWGWSDSQIDAMAPLRVAEPPERVTGHNPPDLAQRDAREAANDLLRDASLSDAEIADGLRGWSLGQLRTLARALNRSGDNSRFARMDRAELLAWLVRQARSLQAQPGSSIR